MLILLFKKDFDSALRCLHQSQALERFVQYIFHFSQFILKEL